MKYNYLLISSKKRNTLLHRNYFLCLVFILSTISYLSSKASNVIHNEYAPSSELSVGTWSRISTDATGIYKLTYDDLLKMQLPVAGAASSSIKICGFGGMLPEKVGVLHYDDLPQLAIKVYDGGDNSFDPGDYLLFYSPGPNSWRYNSTTETYEYIVNLYSDFAYYFVTVGNTAGVRIKSAQQPAEATQQVQFYNHRDVYSPELVNLIKSGKGWYGDFFDIITKREYSFNALYPRQGSDLKLRFSVVARSFAGSTFTLSCDGSNHTLAVAPVVADYTTNYAHISTSLFSQPAPSQFNKVSVTYNKSNSLDAGWLNFIELNADASLKYAGQQLTFRKTGLVGNVEFQISGASSGMYLWDVTDQTTPAEINANLQNGTLSFKANTDTVHEYILAGANDLKTPAFVEHVTNQNLHAMLTPDMVIISPPEFMSEAVRLATFHSNKDDLSVSVVTPQAIYNEFSSGAQDISAIRNFIKMLWDKAEPNNLPRYILLFGDASYDYKNRLPNNTNIIPTYQSPESLHPIYSFATDDFFVSIDDNEGGNTTDVVDIGIGRLPVVNLESAVAAVDKIIHYATDTEKVNGDWRNVIAFVADDEDGNIHMSQADQIATMIDTTYLNYNTDKIYLDAYPQISMAGGQRSPEANSAINQRVNKGALIINYTGHGGETGWTKEQILEVKDITEWKNYDRLPVFMTATCEFSRYDDPVRISAGEYAFLNRNGGAIALFTTSRPTYGTPNFELAKNFYNTALQPINGSMPRLGDIIRLAKIESGGSDNIKKFILLGNPAMTMAYPALDVVTTEINGKPSGENPDTLKALMEVTIKGIITGKDGHKVNEFNGYVIPTVFDKESNIVTLGSDGFSPMSFSLRRNIIYKGRAEVKNGDFSFSFIVPRDIAYNYGPGKISFYASDGVTDAAGHQNNIVVGGFNENEINDYESPDVRLFINDTNFISGGFTDENPILLAFITDESGINTIGNSIGHDIIAILDDNSQDPFILNEYYQSDINTYKSGSLRFPMYNLLPGTHTLKFLIWDVNNNPAEVTTRFNVAAGNELALSELEVWPNPASDYINFSIGHNQAGNELKSELNIYDLSGNKVASMQKTLLPGGYRSSLFQWNGQSLNGKPVSSGLYIANVRITTSRGFVNDKSTKIIIAH